MEIATRLNEPKVADDVFDSETGGIDLGSTGQCIEAALAQVTFTAREIEGVLALDDHCWQSMTRMGLQSGDFPDSGQSNGL